MRKNKTLSFRLDDNLWNDIIICADKYDMNISDFIALACSILCKYQKQEDGKTLFKQIADGLDCRKMLHEIFSDSENV